MKFVYYIIIILVLGACENKAPDFYGEQKDRISDEKMIVLLTEMFKIKGAYNVMMAQDAQANIKMMNSYQKLYAQEGVSEADFENQFRILINDPDRYDQLLSEVIERLNKEKDGI